jgi:hypothetical protein
MHAAPTPSLEAITSAAEPGERVVRARLRMNGAYRANLRIPRTALPRRAIVNGVEADFAAGSDDYVGLISQGRACEGAELTIYLDERGAKPDWFLVGQTPGARTPATDAIRKLRPASATPIHFGDSTITLTQIRVP